MITEGAIDQANAYASPIRSATVFRKVWSWKLLLVR
jgi:hypothetical protein